MTDRAMWRLRDMKRCILEIRSLLGGKSFDEMFRESVTRAAFERFLEILSEASRGVPEDWKKTRAPEVPWRQVADLGNHIRHAYNRLDAKVLWSIYEDDLDQLESAVDAMLAEHDAGGPSKAT